MLQHQHQLRCNVFMAQQPCRIALVASCPSGRRALRRDESFVQWGAGVVCDALLLCYCFQDSGQLSDVVTADGSGTRDDRSSASAATRIPQNTPGIRSGVIIIFGSYYVKFC